MSSRASIALAWAPAVLYMAAIWIASSVARRSASNAGAGAACGSVERSVIGSIVSPVPDQPCTSDAAGAMTGGV